AVNAMIYMRNITITTAKSATYLENVGYTSPAEELYKEISGLEEVFVTCFTSKYIVFEKMPASMIFSNAVIVVGSDEWSIFGSLQSQFHEIWVQATSSTLETRQRYALSDCFYTFPFPADRTGIAAASEAYYRERRRAMQEREFGLTKLMNDFHCPSHSDPQIIALRDAYIAMNRSVSVAYGWNDLDIEFDFLETGNGNSENETRFTLRPKLREEILRRLSELNRSRSNEEANQIPTAKATASVRAARARSAINVSQIELSFDAPSRNRPGSTASVGSAADKIVSYLKWRRSWLSKSEILAYVDIPDGQWNAAINDLLARGTVERQGERRGARYRMSESD
ncbi:hypothetical protein G5V65_21000, partial [Rhodobacter sp. HX-7-19]|nr:hypothetical protein [Rhodobacter kunshanensis]